MTPMRIAESAPAPVFPCGQLAVVTVKNALEVPPVGSRIEGVEGVGE